MKAKNSLFRQAAIESQQVKWLGDIYLVRPRWFSVLTAGAVIIGCAAVALFAFGSYTKRTTVTGHLVPDAGLIKVFAPQAGVVLEKRVTEGQRVKKGDVLYVLSSDRQSGGFQEYQSAISSQVESRQKSFEAELQKTRVLLEEEKRLLHKREDGLRIELDGFDRQIATLKTRVKTAQDVAARYQGLLAQDYASQEQVQQKLDELFELRARLSSTERERLKAEQELNATATELKSLSLKHQNQLAAIQRNISSTVQELAENEARRNVVISAPESGMATAVLVEVGQTIAGSSTPLVSIVPTGSSLQGHLYAPAKTIGFIKEGDRVLIRYQAYPYQKFGHHQAVITSITKTGLQLSELPNVVPVHAPPTEAAEQFHRIVVKLASQTIQVYGKPQPLQNGMAFEADILQDTRRLYEWVLEPLYSMGGKL